MLCDLRGAAGRGQWRASSCEQGAARTQRPTGKLNGNCCQTCPSAAVLPQELKAQGQTADKGPLLSQYRTSMLNPETLFKCWLTSPGDTKSRHPVPHSVSSLRKCSGNAEESQSPSQAQGWGTRPSREGRLSATDRPSGMMAPRPRAGGLPSSQPPGQEKAGRDHGMCLSTEGDGEAGQL